MNEYSALQRWLHRLLLRPNFISEGLLKLDQFGFGRTEITDAYGANNVFICGAARSGTTALLNILATNEQFAVLRYNDLPLLVAPFIGSVLKHVTVKRLDTRSRYHGDHGLINEMSPEAFDEVFFRFEDAGISSYRQFVSRFLASQNKHRYLSKNNQNFYRIPWLLSEFPNSLILVCIRDPLETCRSLLIQHRRFKQIEHEVPFASEYIDLIGHAEFGRHYKPQFRDMVFSDQNSINHWLEQWFLGYTAVKTLVKTAKLKVISFADMSHPSEHPIIFDLLERVDDSIDSMFKGASRVNVATDQLHCDSDLLGRCRTLYDQLRL